MHTYASESQEAVELVSDLEYLWDQIKDLQPSSSDDSATGGVGSSILSRPRHRHHKHRTRTISEQDIASSPGSIAHDNSPAPLTASNLRSYNERQQQQGASSYSSIGNQKDKIASLRNAQQRASGTSSYYPLPESTLGIPPSALGMYRAESYLSGRSVHSTTPKPSSGKGKGMQRSDFNQTKRLSSLQEGQQFIGQRHGRDLDESHSQLGPGVREEEFYDARVLESSSEDVSNLREENLEMKKWRRDVNWALETINEEIMAIRQRYGVVPLHQQQPPSGSGGDQRSKNKRLKQRKDSSTTITDDSDIYRNGIIYTSLVKFRRVLSKFGLVSDIDIDPSSSTSSSIESSFFSSPGSASPPKRKSWLLKLLGSLFCALRRAIIDAIVIHLLVFLVVKYIQRYPQSIQGNTIFSRGLRSWDDMLRNLLISDLLSNNAYSTDFKSVRTNFITRIRSISDR